MCAPVLYTVNGSFPFLPDWNEKKQTLVFLSYSPELIIISHYFWLRSACTHGYMGACLCGCVISVALQEHGVCTWLVFSRQLTGLWWLLLLHLCFGDVRGEWKPKRGRENGDEMKKNVHDGRRKDWEENNTGFKRANPGEGGAERRGTQKRKRTDGLFVYTGLFLWGSVCVFQLWIVDYAKKFMSLSVSLSQPFLSFCRGGLQTFKWSRKHCLWQHSHHPAGAPPRRGWQSWGGDLSLYQPDRHTAARVNRLGLGSHQVLHPSCSLGSSNPLLCPSPWQSCTHVAASHSIVAHTHMYAHQQISAQHAQGGLSLTEEGKKQS